MAHRRRRQEPEEEAPTRERWLLTYSDMITLLMVLFIVLFALGQVDILKFNAFKDSFRAVQPTASVTPKGGPGVLSAPSAIALAEQNAFARLTARSASPASQAGQDQPGEQASGQDQAGEAEKAAQERPALANAQAEMERALLKAGLAREVAFSTDQRGLVVTILTDKVLFPLDSAQLQPEGVAIINALAPVLASLPNLVDVEGDTDNQPIHGGPYADNWALSAARAVAVVETLIHDHGMGPGRLQATGNSDTRPVVPNDSSQHRAENRRVEIVVFSTTVTGP